MKKRLFAMALALVMCLSLLPTAAFAAQESDLIWIEEGTYHVNWPAAGQRMSDIKSSVPEGANYTVGNVTWDEVTWRDVTGVFEPMGPEDVFQAGHEYRFKIVATPNPGYCFDHGTFMKHDTGWMNYQSTLEDGKMYIEQGEYWTVPVSPTPIPVDEEHFPDANLRTWIDHNMHPDDNILSVEAMGRGDSFWAWGELSGETGKIHSLQGLEYITGMRNLNFRGLDYSGLDLGAFPHLYGMDVRDTPVSTLDVSSNSHMGQITADFDKKDMTIRLYQAALGELRFINSQEQDLTPETVTQLENLAFNEDGYLEFTGDAQTGSFVCNGHKTILDRGEPFHYELSFAPGAEQVTGVPATLRADSYEETHNFVLPEGDIIRRSHYILSGWTPTTMPARLPGCGTKPGDSFRLNARDQQEVMMAQWKPAPKLELTFEADDYTIPGTVPENMQISGVGSITHMEYRFDIPPYAPERSGYAFTGWRTYTYDRELEDLPGIVQPGEHYAFPHNAEYSGSVTLEAQWEYYTGERRHVDYVAPDALPGTKPNNRQINSDGHGGFVFTVNTQPVPQRAGYQMMGYRLKRDGKDLGMYQPGDRVTLPPDEGDYQLVALWKQVEEGADLSAPVAEISADPETGKPMLEWNAVKDAESYQIWRREQSGGAYKLLDEVIGTRKMDTSAAVGAAYDYQVAAVTAKGTVGQRSKSVGVTCALPRPTGVWLEVLSPEEVRLHWEPVTDTEYYMMWTSVDGSPWDTWQGVRDRTSNEMDMTPGSECAYAIQATCNVHEAGSALSAPMVCDASGKALLKAPELTVENNPDTGKPVLRWTDVEGAEEYEVLRSESPDGPFTSMYTTSGNRVNHTSAKVGHRYFYQVRALEKGGREGNVCAAQACICVLIQPNVTVSRRSDGKPVLSWDKVAGAEKYLVYCSADGGDFVRLTSVSGTKLNHGSAKPGHSYTYKVCAVTADGNGSSDWTMTDAFTVKNLNLTAPDLTATNKRTTGKPYLKWDKVEGAEEYEVYRATSKDGKYSRLWHGSGTALTNGSAKTGTTYYYKVRAVAADGTKGPFSTIKTRTCDLPCPDVKVTLRSDGKPVLSWKKIDGAVKYEVYRRVDGGDFSRLTTVKGTKLTNTSAKRGHTYTYKVKAIASRSAANSNYSYTDTIKAK